LIGDEPGRIREYYEESAKRGVDRCAGQALLLCERLLGICLPSELGASLKRDRIVCRLDRFALSAMTAGTAERQLTPGDLERVGQYRSRDSCSVAGERTGSMKYGYGAITPSAPFPLSDNQGSAVAFGGVWLGSEAARDRAFAIGIRGANFRGSQHRARARHEVWNEKANGFDAFNLNFLANLDLSWEFLRPIAAAKIGSPQNAGRNSRRLSVSCPGGVGQRMGPAEERQMSHARTPCSMAT
jgi:hypothetical protein